MKSVKSVVSLPTAMKTPSRRHHAAFTLIELMAVITIIVILAGLVVGGMGFVNEKQARSKAKVQIDLLSKALEDYKMDNGSYPPTANSTTGCLGSAPNEKTITVYEPGVDGKETTLYGVLYQYGVTNNTKVYVPELDPANNKLGWTTIKTGADILDPWGKPYRYRTASGKPTKEGDGSITTPTNAATQNPDFDLWSAGKDAYTDTTRNPDYYDSSTKRGNRDDIRNF